MAELTKRQQFWLEHVRRAKASGEPLTRYAKSRGLSIGALNQAKSRLQQRGFLRREGPTAQRADGEAFVPVRIEPVAGTNAACRLRHGSGWELECAALPEPRWLRALIESESGDAAA